MFTTVNNVKLYTNKDVTIDNIVRAQALIEMFIGKSEIDIENVNDLSILDKMTAYQAAYMYDNEDMVFSQIGLNSAGSGDSMQNFDANLLAPFMSPLAIIAARGLSSAKSKSLKTGKIFSWSKRYDWRTL
jgi:hypothetical protein